MKRLITLLFAIAALSFMACEPQQITPNDEPAFEITSAKSVEVGVDGGVFPITYNLTEGDYTSVSAIADDTEMIIDINTNTASVILVSVAPNNNTYNRSARIRVKYGDKAEFVEVHQAGSSGKEEGEYDVVEIKANQLIGNYYGERLQAGLGHYWIILSENGIVDGALAPNAEFFRLDLLGPLAQNEENIRIPDGTYLLGNSYTEFTMPDIGSTDYVYTDAEGESWSVPFSSATLVVRGSSFELTARIETKEFHVSFDGEYNITANIVNNYISTLKEDYVIDLSNCTGTLKSFGDYWQCGYCNWQIEFVCNDGLKYGTYLVLDFLTDSKLSGASGVEGTYRDTGFSAQDSTMPAFASYTFIPGIQISDDGVFMMGSIVQVYKDGIGIDQASLYEGEMVISKNSNGTYTIVVDALDDAPKQNRVTLNWTGVLY